MIDAPKQDWTWYEEKSRGEHAAWLRSLTPVAALTLCEALRSFALRFTQGSPESERLEQEHWREKLAIRRKMLAVFVAWDRRRE